MSGPQVSPDRGALEPAATSVPSNAGAERLPDGPTSGPGAHADGPHHALLRLQGSIGNAAATRLISRGSTRSLQRTPATESAQGSSLLERIREINDQVWVGPMDEQDLESLWSQVPNLERMLLDSNNWSEFMTSLNKGLDIYNVGCSPIVRIWVVHENAWVGPLDEEDLADLWSSYGTALPAQIEQYRGTWETSLDRGMEPDDVEALAPMRADFEADVKAMARSYLHANRAYIEHELARFASSPEGASEADEQADAVAGLQDAARHLERAKDAQQELLSIQVGYTEQWMDHGGMEWVSTVPENFSPDRRPMLDPDGTEDPPLPPWEEVKERYDRASDVIRGLLSRHPALYAAEQTGDAVELATATPVQGREVVVGALRGVRSNVDATLPKIDSGDLDWRDLKPIHAQLFGGQQGPVSGTSWADGLPRDVAKDILDGHESTEFWIALGLGTLAAAAFVVASLATAGTATFFAAAAVGIGASGLQAGMSWEKYEDLAVAEDATVSDEHSLVASGQATAALIQAVLDTVFMFIDIYGVAARGASAAARAASREALEVGERKLGERVAREVAEVVAEKQLRAARQITAGLGLDDAALRRILAKGTNLNQVKGQLFEELANRDIARRLGSGSDELLGVADAAGTEMIAGHLIRDAAGRELTDGMIVRRGSDGVLEIITVIEAKAGRSGSEGLRRTASSIGDSEEFARFMIEQERDGVVTVLRREGLGVEAEAVANGRRASALSDEAIEAIAGDRGLRRTVTQAELGGQVRMDIERLAPNADGTEAVTILIDGAPTSVRLSPTRTRFVGALPSDVPSAKIADDLTSQGISFEALSVSETAGEVTDISKRLIDLTKSGSAPAP